MASPMPDIAVLLAQVMDFVADSEDFWRGIASGTDEIVADDPAKLRKVLNEHAAIRIDLETIEQLIANREEVVRDVFRTQVGVCGEMSAMLCSLAADETNALRRARMMDLSITMQRLGRQLAATALNVDNGEPPRLDTPATPNWTPRVIPGGAEVPQ